MSFPAPEGFREKSVTSFSRFVSRLTFDDGSLMSFAIPGLEDVLHGKMLGEGKYHNTVGTINQLCGAIAFANHPVANNMLSLDRSRDNRAEITRRVAILRDEQVLDGMRILDLGCGVPYFAAAATALGGTTYTADAEDLTGHFPEQSERHSQVDLREPDAVDEIRRTTGESFDFVTEQITAPLPSQDHVSAPSRFAIVNIATPLLRSGGLLAAHTYGLSEHGYERI